MGLLNIFVRPFGLLAAIVFLSSLVGILVAVSVADSISCNSYSICISDGQIKWLVVSAALSGIVSLAVLTKPQAAGLSSIAALTLAIVASVAIAPPIYLTVQATSEEDGDGSTAGSASTEVQGSQARIQAVANAAQIPIDDLLEIETRVSLVDGFAAITFSIPQDYERGSISKRHNRLQFSARGATSENVDSMMELYWFLDDDELLQIAENDNSGGGRNPMLLMGLVRPGRYLLLLSDASSLNEDPEAELILTVLAAALDDLHPKGSESRKSLSLVEGVGEVNRTSFVGSAIGQNEFVLDLQIPESSQACLYLWAKGTNDNDTVIEIRDRFYGSPTRFDDSGSKVDARVAKMISSMDKDFHSIIITSVSWSRLDYVLYAFLEKLHTGRDEQDTCDSDEVDFSVKFPEAQSE